MTAATVFQEKEEWFEEIGIEAGLVELTLSEYVKFMLRRFPDERHKSYAQEWAQRYASGMPEAYADKESLLAIEIARNEVKP